MLLLIKSIVLYIFLYVNTIIVFFAHFLFFSSDFFVTAFQKNKPLINKAELSFPNYRRELKRVFNLYKVFESQNLILTKKSEPIRN